ncbi:hypothetical protein FEZ48_02720 [Marinilactibacillus psychrotolerans]|uniref:Uncharacterized protein n=1 Tax=Marinilactibacillus psychrotolerans TaxID=191770 RepID=A0A5R9C720_9LACT|nr:hypothetical protein [Marinilactibacillus psychrotolerans]TLQ08815.1 hypothetical protein FEZ48_02720 [Marinilactibacillus psychrotolerans]
MTAEINTQEHIITILTNEGNAPAVGFIAKVNQFPVSLFPKPKGMQGVELVVSDIKTGVKLQGLYITLPEFWMADTKDKALDLFTEKLEQFKTFMTPEMIEQIKVKRAAYPEVPKPKLTAVSIEDWMKGAGE